MSIFSFYAVLLIAHLVNFRSAGFIISSLFYSDQYTVARGLLPLHRSKHSRTSILSRGNQLCMLKEDSTVVTGGDDKDLSILSGRGRDRVSTYNAIKNLMRDPLFLQKSNSLKLISDALKRCGTPSDQMLYFWKKAVHHGVAVRKRDVKDMLYYCYDYGRRDTVTIKKALETVCSLDKAKYWNSLIMNLIIQIYTERIDGAYEINKSGILLRDIVRDVISTDEKIMDEKSLVMLLKYFSGMEDYKSLNLVFSSRKNATKRPLEGQLVDIDIEVRFTENVVVWNAYLTALMKLSAKGNDSLDNQFLAEANEMLKTMIDLKIADFYTMCIMLEFYAGKINANKKNTNTKKSEELVNKCLEVWNNAYFSNLIKSNQQYDKFDDIPRGLKISYATMIKCLLLSADLANGQEGKKTTNVDSNTISDGTEQKSKLIVDNYVNIALKLALEVPSDEVTSALLFSLGLAEENCEVAIKYMKILIEKSRSMSKYESKSESEIEKEGQSSAKTECEDTISSKSDTNDKTAVQKSTKNRTMKDSQNHGKLYCTNHIDSLLNGYYYSNRTDLVTEAYFLAHENLSKTTTNKNQFSTLKISKLNIEGSTKAFNIFLASLKLMVRSNTIEEKSKDQLWRFSRSVIKERVAAETRRLSAGLRDEKTDEKREERRGNGESKEMNRSDNETPSFFDSYTTIISMDLANMLSDYAMSRDLFYQHETTSPPSERAVQTYLRSFQAPSQLFELDKLVNVALEKSQRYKVMFSAYPDPKGDNTRTFDEIINAYLRVGNLPIALEYAAKYSNKFSDSAMKNLLIRFDRFWRDYDNQTVYLDDLLKGQERLERNHRRAMNSYLEANLQGGTSPPQKDYYSKEAERHVRSPAVYAELQDVTGRCLTAEVGILSDILFLRAGDKPPSYVLWSVLVGVSISRGDWDTAVDVLIKMEGDENSILLKNRYAKDQRGDSKPSKKMYKGAEVSQAVELGVLYAIDGGLPLLTRGGGDALQALNLDRLIPKESSSPTGEESTTNINKNEENKEGEVVAAKSQKVHNLLGISHSLNQIPKKLLLETASKRTVCTMGDILGFLERCRGSDGDQNEGGDGTISEGTSNTRSSGLGNGANFLDESSSSYDEYSTYDDYDTYVPARKEPIKKARVPVGVALLQSLFAAAINERKYKQAARIIRLLEGSRLVIDLDAPALVAVPPIIAAKDEFNAFITASVSASDATDTAEKNKIRKILGRASDSPSDASAVKVVRETLARKWAALLIGSSLNKLKNNVAGSVKMMAALKYLQKEQTDELN